MSNGDKGDEPNRVSTASLWFLRIVLVVSLAIFALVTLTEHYRQKQVVDAPPLGPGPKDSFIVPGERIGMATLNLDVQQVFPVFGTPKVETSSNATVYRFSEVGVKCVVDQGRISSVLTDNPNFRTKLNTHVGSALETVLAELGSQFETSSSSAQPPKNGKTAYVMHYWKKGIHFSIADDKVQSIWVTGEVGQ